MCNYKLSESHNLHGEITVSCAKNAVLPILFATLLTDQKVIIQNAPKITDVQNALAILQSFGAEVENNNQDITILAEKLVSCEANLEAVRKMRASILVMGPLLSRLGRVCVAMPGGCAIGTRPIDMHLKALKQMGADIQNIHGTITATAKKLMGTEIYLDFPSVGATENIIMAAVSAQGTTTICNAATEPEIEDLCSFLVSMGAQINGIATDRIEIVGVHALHGTTYTPIPDRIEAGTYMNVVAACGGDVTIKNIQPKHLKAISSKLTECGVIIEENKDYLRIIADKRLKSTDITVLPYPGFPTDMQAPMMVISALAEGTSIIVENVFENRFLHIAELIRMGADIKIDDRTAIINGVDRLYGTEVEATDLRGGAAMIIAGLSAKGTTIIKDQCHIERGYDSIVEKLSGIGANISLID